MKITVDRLKHVMNLAAPAVPSDKADSRPALPLVLFKEGYAIGNKLDLAIAVEVPELGDEVFMLRPKTMEQTLKSLPGNSMLEFTVDSGQVTLKAAHGFTMHAPLGEPNNFPAFPVFDRMGGGELDGDDFTAKVGDLLPYTAKKNDRPVLKGVCLTLGEVLEMGAGDGDRLAWRDLEATLTTEDEERTNFVVPAQALRVLQRLWRLVEKRPRAASSFGVERLANNPSLQVASLATAKRYIEVTLGMSQISFKLGDATLVSSLLPGTFPNYRSLVPETFIHSVVFDAGEGYRAIRQMAPLTPPSGRIDLAWRGKVLTVSVTNTDTGDAQTTLEVSTQGRASHIAFHKNYLLQILKDKDGPVLMETGAPSGPGRFTHSSSPNILVSSMTRAGQRTDPEPEEPGTGDDSDEETPPEE